MTPEYLLYNEGLYGQGWYPEAVSQGVETTVVNRALTPLPPPVFTGMKLQSDFSLGSLVLNRIDPSTNVVWVCTGLSGWWDLPEPIMSDIPKGWNDGNFDADGRFGPRDIELTGVFLPPDPSDVTSARLELVGVLKDMVRSGVWLKVGPATDMYSFAAYVRLSGRPNIETVLARGRTEFSIGLRAADPIIYEWFNGNNTGTVTTSLQGANTGVPSSGTATVTNAGNYPVGAVFTVTGPVVSTTTIANTTRSESMTIISPLRASETLTVTNKALTSNVATLTISGTHTLVAGDEVVISGVDATFDGTYTVASAPTTSTFTYAKTAGNVASAAASGTVDRAADVLEIDTTNRRVAYNGSYSAARSKLDTVIDWVRLGPGDNTITFTDSGDVTSDAQLDIAYRSGYIAGY